MKIEMRDKMVILNMLYNHRDGTVNQYHRKKATGQVYAMFENKYIFDANGNMKGGGPALYQFTNRAYDLLYKED